MTLLKTADGREGSEITPTAVGRELPVGLSICTEF